MFITKTPPFVLLTILLKLRILLVRFLVEIQVSTAAFVFVIRLVATRYKLGLPTLKGEV